MTMSVNPLISVVIPAYNYARTLPRAVLSVLPQLEGASAELLVIDDGSTDSTPQVIEDLQAQHPGRFRSIRKSNGGLASVRNLGITEALGTFLVFLDADDELAPGGIAALASHIEANPESRLVIGAHWSVFPDGRKSLHTPKALPEGPRARVRGYLLDKTISISNGACAMHREVFRAGNYPEQFRNSEDIPVFAQVLARHPCSVLEYPVALIHKHDDSLRHNVQHAHSVGLRLVDEMFATPRLPGELHDLRREYTAQRCLSLFRTFMAVGESETAKGYYREAVRTNWKVLFNLSYTRKALRLLFRG